MKSILVASVLCLLVTQAWAQSTQRFAVGHSNPAAEYCVQLGYQLAAVEDAGGAQHSACVFPDDSSCDAWEFFTGSCGADFSYCAQHGFTTATQCDGADPFSPCYAVCVDAGGNVVGSVTELMGLIGKYRRPFEQPPPVIALTFTPSGATTTTPGSTLSDGSEAETMSRTSTAAITVAELPASFDWRSFLGSDWMTSVKDQAECGACWAFSAVGVTEAAYNIFEGDPNLDINLAEEYLNSDCDIVESGVEAGSCCGGWHDKALNFIKNYGISNEQCLPFNITGLCSCFGGPGCGASCAGLPATCSAAVCTDRCLDYPNRLVQIADYTGVASDVTTMKQKLIENGPLSVCLAMSGKFDAQSVYDCKTCWDHNGNGTCDTGAGTCNTTTNLCTAGSVGAACNNDADCVEDQNGDASCDESDCGINHCVVITGYDDAINAWVVKNSWGDTWGQSGDGYFNVGYGECHIEEVPYYVQPADLAFPEVSVPGALAFDDTCSGSQSTETLNVCNTGTADLLVSDIASSNPVFDVAPPSTGYPVIISHDFCYPFPVKFAPTSAGSYAGELTVESNDSGHPAVQVALQGKGLAPALSTLLAAGGAYGDVCLGSYKDLELTLANSGGCDLVVTGITSSSPEFKTASVVSYPLVVAAGGSIQVPIRLEPASYGAKSATLSVQTSAGDRSIAVTGNTPQGELRLTGSTDLGDVCPETWAGTTIGVCNVGACNVNVSSATFVPACEDFTITGNPFPAAVSPDSCLDLTVRFTPTSSGPKSCTLTVDSDASNTPISVPLTANTPSPQIDVPPDLCFPPTVIQSVGPCESLLPFPISNTGLCNLEITNIATTGVGFSLASLPSFPIVLQPGDVAGDGDLRVRFAPSTLARSLAGTVSVTYVTDGVTGATATVTRTLSGEGVRTGARVLVTGEGVPLDRAEKVQIQRLNGNRNKTIVDTVDTSTKVPLQTVTPGTPCGDFQYHREYGTVDNPLMLLPGTYQVTVSGIVNGKRRSSTVGFGADTCTFNPTVVVDLP